MSYYLDSVCAEYSWMGLVYKDYEAVLPLPLNKRIPLFNRIMLPHFAQQLGVFSTQSIDTALVTQFIRAIPSSFRSVYLQLNEANPIEEISEIETRYRSNYVLSLDKSYEEIKKGYSKNLKRNITKAAKNQLNIGTVEIDEFIPFYLANDKAEYISRSKASKILRTLLSSITQREVAVIHAVRDQEQTLIAACVITSFNGRLTYLMAKSSEEGKEKRAMHGLINHIIEAHHAEMDCLDFEGSDIPSIARFFTFFGAEDVPYSLVKYDRFPFSLFG